MTINNIKSYQRNRGFTIVELLVVIVVIGILAAITIVSYSGITAKANTARAQNNAQSIAQVIETYFAENGVYPSTTALVEGGSASIKAPSGVDVVPNAGTNPLIAATFTSPNWDKFDITYECNVASCGATTTGGRLTYWDFSTGAVTTTPITFGVGGSGQYPAS